MNLEERIKFRNSLQKCLIWDFSSSSEEDIPQKKPKITESQVADPEHSSSPSPSPFDPSEYRPSFPTDQKTVAPKLLEHLGYINRNSRPPFSRKNEILSTSVSKKSDFGSTLNSQHEKEQKKLENFKMMLAKPH